MILDKKSLKTIFLHTVILTVLFIFPGSVSHNIPLFASPLSVSNIQGKLQPLTAQQTLRIRQINDLQLSPDGRHLAMVVLEPVEEASRKSSIWIYDRELKSLTRFTFSEKTDRHPRWSPGGKDIAFLSDRMEKMQIFRIAVNGGESEALTDSKTNIASFEWAPDGIRLAYMAPEPKTEEQEKKQKDKDDVRVVDLDDVPSRLWLLNTESKEITQLTTGDWQVSSYSWKPGGDRLIVSATDKKTPELLTDRLYAIRISDGAIEEIAGPVQPFAEIKISPDGKNLAYLGTRHDGPIPHDLYLMSLNGGKAVNLTGSSIDRPIGSYSWLRNDKILAQAVEGFTTCLYTLDLKGQVEKHDPYPVPASGTFVANRDLIAFVGQNATQMPEVWVSGIPGKAEKISYFNSEWDAIHVIEPEIVRYPSFDCRSIEAGMLLPEGFMAGVRVPLIVLVHGGPSGRWSDSFQSWGQLLAQSGFAVLYPNVRGSIGYGHDFLTANRKDWGGGDFKDVMAGVDYMVAEGIADPDRLGIGGWSYGGYMAAWAVTQTDRFKASVSGAPMTDLASEYGTEMASINAYDTWFMGNPYENLELFQERSPVAHVKHVKTPTLLLTGENDVTDPIGQCQQFYRGLRRYGVDTEFVVYPREGHGIREEKHQIDLLSRVISWFEKYVKKK
ncbi:MAG: S9 family peptidase [Candidatus Aminicenantes bacterium]|nr:S9 family peptidase [Candidatus Aminicenantes bacterium]